MENTEQMYDLSVISRDKLHFLLNTAREEIVKYTDAGNEVGKCKRCIKEEIEKENTKSGCAIFGLVMCVFFIFDFIFCAVYLPMEGGRNDVIRFVPFIIIIVIFAVISGLCIKGIINNKSIRKTARKDKEKYESQLLDLQRKEKETINDFKAALIVPNNYCYEYALTTMLQFIDNKRADNWKEVTALYEEHLHRVTLEENASQQLELSKQQVEYARQTRNSSRMAAAGTWASAAGIWRINSKL
ncbi:hypothetical protein FACS189434_08380 [Bacteroidia bacterium]|nr:hypothetical protein FACS189434_08380 [Bacteroidia bacterium]